MIRFDLDSAPEELAMMSYHLTGDLVRYLREPESQAYLAGCFVTMLLIGHRRLPLPLTITAEVIGGYAAIMAYRAACDLRAVAKAAAGADSPDIA